MAESGKYVSLSTIAALCLGVPSLATTRTPHMPACGIRNTWKWRNAMTHRLTIKAKQRKQTQSCLGGGGGGIKDGDSVVCCEGCASTLCVARAGGGMRGGGGGGGRGGMLGIGMESREIPTCNQ